MTGLTIHASVAPGSGFWLCSPFREGESVDV